MAVWRLADGGLGSRSRGYVSDQSSLISDHKTRYTLSHRSYRGTTTTLLGRCWWAREVVHELGSLVDELVDDGGDATTRPRLRRRRSARWSRRVGHRERHQVDGRRECAGRTDSLGRPRVDALGRLLDYMGRPFKSSGHAYQG